MLRLDFDPPLAEQVEDLPTLSALLAATFQHRRKKIATAAKRRDCPFEAQAFAEGLRACEIDPDKRPEQVGAKGFRRLANWLNGKGVGSRKTTVASS
jgi:16S rRNA A1518/A1519 N6-dimethyltransferase RsmA/KsgA/DIM1 with predicted DNA glycosylase/AP lyase activity